MQRQGEADWQLMGAALALGRRAAGHSRPNPNVGCIVAKEGRIIGRGWTAAGGRPHAEAMALAEAGADAEGATAYVTLEPCAHQSDRGPACAKLLRDSKVARLVYALEDPDPRTAGKGAEHLRQAGIVVESGLRAEEASRDLDGFRLARLAQRPELTLKLAISLDGRMATAGGESMWITSETARAHGHLERARADAVAVGRGTFEADAPRLSNRLPGSRRQPVPVLVSSVPTDLPAGWRQARDWPDLACTAMTLGWLRILVEGGPTLAAALLAEDVVDRLLLYRAPILIGPGAGLEGFAPESLAAAHGRWRLLDRRA
ncbi:MAG: bifunctional diaminohydroxyphosphoribosylaminopyrimidine deaminase/5-amino-6-(5-phosphoribosylamino)uracil reductase RibD, partial [Thermaurantiacus sp.]